MLRWMFFEQYSHEPALAVLRYLLRFASPETETHQVRIAELEAKSRSVLGVLEKHLSESEWVVGSTTTIADFALYPYSPWMDEIGCSSQDWPAINRWLARFEQVSEFLPPYADGASEVIEFSDYFKASSSRD